MALQRQLLTNNNSDWNENQRYKVGDVVQKLGVVYQNSTGKNSDPLDLTDWVQVSPLSNNFTQYKEDFAYVGSNSFTVADRLVITQVLYNKSDITDWSLSGTTLTIVGTLVADDVIGVRGFTY
jgi:hypothetical protein